MESLLGGELRVSDAAQRRKFGLTLRCGASALTLAAASVATPAFAQQAPAAAAAPVNFTLAAQDNPAGSGNAAAADQPTPDAQGGDNEVVVQGIRQSLRRSRDIKRDSDVVVDSITAEDISALPDRSVTEAIQRIPGVAIDRFSAGRDPDHFSTEGSGVVVRGLTYVRSELNGRDTFTANNGRGLSFSDVPSELLGGVDVFKSPSSDMIEGGISGSVNLRTRLPFDNAGLVVAGSLEVNWGDMREEFTPTGSILFSDRWAGDWGELGVLASFSYSELKWRNDAVQISDWGRRTLYTNGDVVQSGAATPVGGTACTAAATEASCVYLPRGAVMRTQDTDRQRYGYSGAIQYRSPNRDVLATLQFLRSDSRESWTEHTIEVATDNVTNNGDSRAVPGTTLSFDSDGIFDSGFITGPTGWRDDQNNTSAWGGNGDVRTPRYGLQSNNQRRDRDDRFVTTDIAANVRWDINDHVSLNADYQHVDSSVDILDTTLWMSTFQNAFIDLDGNNIPVVEFRPPEVCEGPATNSPCTDLAGGASDQDPSYFGVGHNSFSDPFNSFYRSAMDHIEQSDGNEDSMRLDFEYRFPDESWIDSVRVGYRYANRENVARFSQYNWGVLSEIWGGRGPVWVSDPVDGNPTTNGGTNTAGAVETFDFPGFMRGRAGDPQLGNPRLWYSGNTAETYYGAYREFALRIGDEWRARNGANGCPQNWVPLDMRCGTVDGGPFRPGEINNVSEDNNAAYAVVRFSNEFNSGVRLSGNIGLRYTRTQRSSLGNQVFNLVAFTDDYNPAAPVFGTCGAPPDPAGPPGPPPAPTPFCQLPANVRAAARAWSNGAVTPSTVSIDYDYFLPALNLKLEVGHGVQFRFAYNRNLTPPEFGYTRNFYNLSLSANLTDIQAGGGLPVARANVGNPYLLPIRSENFDFSAEWYFSDVGQLTLALFYKRLHGVLTNDTARLPFTNNGATFDAIVTTPGNSSDTGTIKGLEIAYQQVFDFLPGALHGLGINASYTFVDSSGVAQSTLSETDPDVAAGNQANVNTGFLPLQGLSRHTINIAPFYESGSFSFRLAYNWRSRFLLTVRDVIVPFAPIFNEATGQLDASIFFSINDHIRVGVQGVNLLNEVIRTTSVIRANENEIVTAPRSWFMNDRRFSFIVRARF
jgi:TonB-dependent receptor